MTPPLADAALRRTQRLALVALVAGAVGIGFAPIFVRWSDLGPSATGFHRMFLALPLLGLLFALEQRRSPEPPRPLDRRTTGLFVLAGVFFACDLAFWHWSIHTTSVADATLLTNLAPVFVTIAAWLLWKERPTAVFLVGLALAVAGAALLVGASLEVSRRAALGDLLGVASAVFYAAYQIAIRRARQGRSTLAVMTASTSVSAVALLAIALVSGESVIPSGSRTWTVLFALALVSQVAGQGLIAYGLLHLPSGFSSVTLLVQPIVATLLAWVLLHEAMGNWSIVGGVVVLVGIVVARLGSIGVLARNGPRDPGTRGPGLDARLA